MAEDPQPRRNRRLRSHRHGRGAQSNPPGRFEKRHVVQEIVSDDGAPARESDRLQTTLSPERSRSIITRNDSPDVPFAQSINPYRGCEHGCSYCFARPSHAYLGLSPGLDFETRLFFKPDAPALLREALANPRYLVEPLAIGANTDPYQPIERERRLTRSLIEVLVEHQHPFCIVTKSDLVLRDLDLIAPMATRNLAAVCISVTTLDLELAGRMEPRAPRPPRRLAAIAELARARVPVCVLASPMIPAINDAELELVLAACASAGATSAGYILLRLPLELKTLFDEWLEAHYPLRKERVLKLLRECHDGQLYRPEFGQRMRGTGPYAELLAQRFAAACARLGLDRERPPLDTTQFRRPPRGGEQLSLL